MGLQGSEEHVEGLRVEDLPEAKESVSCQDNVYLLYIKERTNYFLRMSNC